MCRKVNELELIRLIIIKNFLNLKEPVKIVHFFLDSQLIAHSILPKPQLQLIKLTTFH